MKAKDFVKSKYPYSTHFPMTDNIRMQTSYVILKHGSYQYHYDLECFDMEIFTNEGATTPSKAWTNAKKEIIEKESKK